MGLRNLWLSFRVGEAKLHRLETELASTRNSVERRSGSGPAAGWLGPARAALDSSEAAMKAGNYDAAWKHLHDARRLEVAGYSDAEVKAIAQTLHAEASAKLASWRQSAAVNHLTLLLDCAEAGDEERVRLADAMRIRDEHYDNQYFKLRLVQKQVALLLWLLLILLVAFGLLFWLRHPILTSAQTAIGPAKLLAGILVGAMGACFSGLLSLVATSPSGTIPERIASTTVTFARPAIGAVSGFAAVLLLAGGLLGGLPATTMLAVAFAFGFSERLAIGALEKVGSR